MKSESALPPHYPAMQRCRRIIKESSVVAPIRVAGNKTTNEGSKSTEPVRRRTLQAKTSRRQGPTREAPKKFVKGRTNLFGG
jgi:hypothetical protein